MYYMVMVEGMWDQTHTVSANSTYTMKRGWDRHVSTSVSTAVSASVEAGFDALASWGSGSFSGSVSYSVATATVNEINTREEYTESHEYTIGYGGYLWTWIWLVKSGDHDRYVISTKYVVQSDVSPKCVPTYQNDREYQTCLPGGTI